MRKLWDAFWGAFDAAVERELGEIDDPPPLPPVTVPPAALLAEPAPLRVGDAFFLTGVSPLCAFGVVVSVPAAGLPLVRLQNGVVGYADHAAIVQARDFMASYRVDS